MQAGLECTETEQKTIAAKPGQKVKLSVETEGLKRSFYVDGELIAALDNVTCLADEGIHMGKRFTGAMVGVYALNCTATFNQMAYNAK